MDAPGWFYKQKVVEQGMLSVNKRIRVAKQNLKFENTLLKNKPWHS